VDKFEYWRWHSNHVHPKFFFNYFFLKPLKHNDIFYCIRILIIFIKSTVFFLSVVIEMINLWKYIGNAKY
jgi:hypothetical protein